MPTLQAILSNTQFPVTPLILVQSRLSQHLPIVKTLLDSSLRSKHHVVLITFTTPAKYFAQTGSATPKPPQNLTVIDWTCRVPGYDTSAENAWHDPRQEILATVQSVPSGLVSVFVEGADTLASDLESVSKAFGFLRSVFLAVKSRPSSSRLVISLSPSSDLLPLLIPPTALSQSLTHLILHPPSLLTHLATSFLTLPPPYTPESKFWALFTGAAERGEGVEPRVIGMSEGLLESRVRARKVERQLEGWRVQQADGLVEACRWDQIAGMQEVLDSLRRTQQVSEAGKPPVADPTQNLPFNLVLTPSQQHARSLVPLPYAHAGDSPSKGNTEIDYEPDSGDDVDDDDPDEDLDI